MWSLCFRQVVLAQRVRLQLSADVEPLHLLMRLLEARLAWIMCTSTFCMMRTDDR